MTQPFSISVFGDIEQVATKECRNFLWHKITFSVTDYNFELNSKLYFEYLYKTDIELSAELFDTASKIHIADCHFVPKFKNGSKSLKYNDSFYLCGGTITVFRKEIVKINLPW